MKNLIALSVLLLAVDSFAACSITLKKKKMSAKTAILANVNVSAKVLKALQSQCDVRFSAMTQDELILLEKVKYQAKIKKLKGL